MLIHYQGLKSLATKWVASTRLYVMAVTCSAVGTIHFVATDFNPLYVMNCNGFQSVVNKILCL